MPMKVETLPFAVDQLTWAFVDMALASRSHPAPPPCDPAGDFTTVTRGSDDCYSHRSATSGSTFVARRAGR